MYVASMGVPITVPGLWSFGWYKTRLGHSHERLSVLKAHFYLFFFFFGGGGAKSPIAPNNLIEPVTRDLNWSSQKRLRLKVLTLSQ